MGAKDSKLSYDITVKLNQDHKATKFSKKLLILGPGKSGKSTLFHRLKLIDGNGFTQKERMRIKYHIYKHIIHSMQHILKCIHQYQIHDDLKLDTEIAQQCSQIILNIDLNDYDDIMSININHNDDIMTYIDILCQEKAVQQIVQNASKYYIEDSMEYFLNHTNILRMSDYTNYIPNNEDMIQFHHTKHNNLCEAKINIRKDTFLLYDINYDINYNKNQKWMHCFDDVTALIFITSLISYSEIIFDEEQNYLKRLKMKIALDLLIDIVGVDVLELIIKYMEDPIIGKNAMIESIKLFDHIINNKWFSDQPIILMLNKKDLLQTRIVNDDDVRSFISCFPEFNQLVCYQKCMEYIQWKFTQQNKNDERHIYTHYTSATTDNDLVERLFNDVQSIVLEHCLRMGNHL